MLCMGLFLAELKKLLRLITRQNSTGGKPASIRNEEYAAPPTWGTNDAGLRVALDCYSAIMTRCRASPPRVVDTARRGRTRSPRRPPRDRCSRRDVERTPLPRTALPHSGRDRWRPSGRTWAGRFFELNLLEQQIRDELSEPAILHLQLGHNIGPPALGAMSGLEGRRRRRRSRMIELAPAIERHDAHAQRLGDLALHSAIGGKCLGLLELGGDFSGRMSPGLHGSFPPDIGGPLQACPRDACSDVTGAIVNNNRCLTGQTTINA